MLNFGFMKPQFIRIFGFLALLGIVNAALIEPAICYTNDSAIQHQEESEDCCAVCHPAHHQGVIRDNMHFDFDAIRLNEFISSSEFTLLEIPTRSIFHPPIVA